MRVNVVGGTLGFGLKLAAWLRDLGIESQCYAFDNGFQRDMPAWELGAGSALPAWFHFRSGEPVGRPLWPRPALTRELADCDVLLASGGYEPIFAARTGRPYIIWSLGGDLEALPFSSASLHSRLCARAQRQAIRKADLVIYSMLFQEQRSLRALGLTKTRFVPIPMDPEQFGPLPQSDAQDAAPVAFRDADLVVFGPARHQIDPNRYHYKGNEQLLLGFAEFRRSWSGATRLVMVRNGEYQTTQQLIDQLGLADCVSIEPMYDRTTMRAILSLPNVVVADQFNSLAGLGFTGLETLFSGRILITSWDRAGHSRVYSEPAPLLAASNAHEIAVQLRKVAMMSTEERQAFSERARSWAIRFHGQRTIMPQVVAMLENAQADRRRYDATR